MYEQTTRTPAARKLQTRGANVGPQRLPPREPTDTAAKRGEDNAMELRIAKLESFGDECRRDMRSVDVRLAKIETVAEALSRNAATKADVSQLEATLIKWFLGTAVATAGAAFGFARLLQ